MDIVDSIIMEFSYDDLERNLLIHRAAEEIRSLRRRVRHLESEVTRLEREAHHG